MTILSIIGTILSFALFAVYLMFSGEGPMTILSIIGTIMVIAVFAVYLIFSGGESPD